MPLVTEKSRRHPRQRQLRAVAFTRDETSALPQPGHSTPLSQRSATMVASMSDRIVLQPTAPLGSILSILRLSLANPIPDAGEQFSQILRQVQELCCSSCSYATRLLPMTSGSALGAPATSPFSPHFGTTPLSVVGRSGLLSEIGSGLVTGPGDQRYTSILMGVRGSGKTVALNEIEDRAAADGWVVLSMDAGTPGLLDRIVRAISQADRTYEALGLGEANTRRSVERSIGIRLGLLEGRVAETAHDDHTASMGLREHLACLAEAAQRHGASVLLTIDELQGIDRTEGRRLSNDLQHITKRAGMRLAFLGAGLLELKHTLMRDRKMTFFHRCEHFDMPPLDVGDATVGLVDPITSAGGAITDEALRLAAGAVNGSPYRLQVVGDIAWKAARAPEREIDARAVRAAIAAAEGVVNARVGVPAWHDLSQGDQRVLEAVAAAGGTATPAEAAQDAQTSGKSASATLRRLADLGYLDNPRPGVYGLASLVPMDVILDESGHSDWDSGEGGRSERTIGRSPAAPSAATPRCRRWMPRAKAYCVLAKNHTGGCRSR